ncbi:MAG: nucleotidyltransferase family protein [Candidatus Diapherotrites archaeon]|nr:nucleotidyltransferase family protein [Candidatus Diapherotrites archaeon]
MKAIILAAGYGTRLYPLTLNKPKPLIEVKEKLILEWILFKLNEVKALEEVFIVSNEKFYSNFVEWSEKNKEKFSFNLIVLNDGTKSNEDRLGAVGDIFFAVKEKNINDDLLVIGGDNLFEFSVKEFIEFSRKKNSSSVALKYFEDKMQLANKFGVVEINENKRIISFEEKPAKPKTNYASTACYYFLKKDLQILIDFMNSGKSFDNSGDFVKYLSENSEMYGFEFTGNWFDIGSIELLEKARREFNE